MLGLPAIAVSQQSAAREMDFRLGERFDFDGGRRVRRADGRGDRRRAAARRHAAERQRPGGRARAASRSPGWASASTATQLALEEEDAGRQRYRIYGDAPGYHARGGTDLAAVAAGRIAVTPLHFDLTDEPGLETLGAYDLARLLAPAADEVE